MKILVVVATRSEIAPLLEHFNLSDEDYLISEDFDVLVTGVGMTATAFALGQKLSNSYQLILNLGIAGSFDHTLALGSVVNIHIDQFSELGAEDGENFLPIDDLGFGQAAYHARNNLLNTQVTKLKKVTGITVNTVHGEKNSIQSVSQRLNPTTESMEGAAVLFCCEKAAIPCLQIRSISNYVTPRDKSQWKIGLAIKNLNQWAIDFLTNG